MPHRLSPFIHTARLLRRRADHGRSSPTCSKKGQKLCDSDSSTLPLYFEGKRINKRTVHVVRFSAEAGMYAKGIPSAPTPSRKEKATLHASLAAPPFGKVAHVDLFLSSVRRTGRTRRRSEPAMLAWARSSTPRACI
jgi:hypothetical protein